MGIIDTLTAGFDLVRKRPWLIALPVALDIGLWVAPRLSVLSLVRGALTDLMAAAAGASPETLQELREQGQTLLDLAQSTNLASLLVSSPLGVPSLAVEEMPSFVGQTRLAVELPSFFGRARQVVELQGGLSLVALAVGLFLVGLFIAAFYLGLIAQAVRDGRVDWPRLLARVPRYWLRLIGAGLLITLTLLSFTLPASLVAGLFYLLSPVLAWLFLGVVFVLAFWVMLYMLFVPEAILLSEDGIVKAIWRSAMIMRTSLLPALGLFLLGRVIAAGLLFIWVRLTATAPGAVVAIVANAFIGTGLTAALFVFYRERLRAPKASAEPQRS